MTSPSGLAPGHRLGRYELLHPLGRGAYGEVWAATLHGPMGFQRAVALKVLHPSAHAAARQQALMHEARLGALASHPHVVGTLELGAHQGRWFMAMELVHGLTAEALRQRGPLPGAALVDLGVQACHGLAYIHQLTDPDGEPLGLVHRDIKPNNLLVDTQGVVRIVDLGIARWRGGEDRSAGTPGYLPPEQIDGEAVPASDVFALGCTLIRLATGRKPLGGPGYRARLLDVEGHVHTQLLREALDARVPGLAEVLFRAVRTRPQDRWADAAAMGTALAKLGARCPDDLRLPGLVAGAVAPAPTAVPEGGPVRPVELVGRARELEALRAHARPGAWVVVKGPAGVGTSRLVEAWAQVDARPVRACDLSGVGDPAVARRRLAASLGTRDASHARMAEALQGLGPVIWAVDGLEGVASAVGPWLDRWGATAPEATVVATSRVAVPGARGVELRVGPLRRGDAVALLIRRTGGALPRERAEAMVARCGRLPLVLELTAARLRAEGFETTLAGLGDPQTTEEGTEEVLAALDLGLDRSWQALSDGDRAALARLSAFQGPLGLEDARAVLPVDGPGALARLERLVEHSMVQVRGARFRLLLPVRAFVRRHADPAERAQGERRHWRWMARLGAAEVTELQANRATLRACAAGMDDLVVAYDRAAAAGDARAQVDLAIAAYHGLVRLGAYGQAEARLRDAMPTGLRPHALQRRLAHTLTCAGKAEEAVALCRQGLAATEGVEAARYQTYLAIALRVAEGGGTHLALLEQAVRTLRAAGHPRYLAALGELATEWLWVGRTEEAVRAFEHILGHGAAAVDRGHHEGFYAAALAFAGRFEASNQAFERSLAELDALGDRRTACTVRVNHAESLLHQGRLAAAERQGLRGAEQGERSHLGGAAASASAMAAQAQLRQGDAERARATATRGLRFLEGSRDANARCDLLTALAGAHDALGDRERAHAILLSATTLEGPVFDLASAFLALQLAEHGDGEAVEAVRARWPRTASPPVLVQACDALVDAWRGRADGRARAEALLDGLDLGPEAPLRASLRRLQGAM